MATTTATTTVSTTTPQEMPSNDPPPSYSPAAGGNTNEDITAAQPTTTTETATPVDEKRALQEPQPALVQPMQAEAQTDQPQPINPLDHPVSVQALRETPAAIDCPHCHNRVMTTTNLESGNTVTGWAVCLCCLAGVCFAWIPCVMDSCKDTVHSCSTCKKRVVTITNSGSVKVHSQPVTPRPQPQTGSKPAAQTGQSQPSGQQPSGQQPSPTARVG